jgi:hypothetical protein
MAKRSGPGDLSEQDKQDAGNTIQYCQDWQHAIQDVWDAIREGVDPETVESSRITITTQGPVWTRLTFLEWATRWLANATVRRYPWFDSKPLWELHAEVALWSSGDRSEARYVRIYALDQSIRPSITRLISNAMRDLGLLQGAFPSQPESPNETRNAMIVEMHQDGKSIKEIGSTVRRLAKEKGWRPIVDKHVSVIIKRHEEANPGVKLTRKYKRKLK